MARTNLPTYFRIASCMRSAILNTSMFHWDGFGLLTFALTEASAKEIGYFSTVFFQRWLPIILPWTITEKCCVHNLVALSLSARTGWQWAGPKLHSLLSAHRLIGACFLTTESDKRMRLLTRLYGTLLFAYTINTHFWWFLLVHRVNSGTWILFDTCNKTEQCMTSTHTRVRCVPYTQ